MHLQNRHRLDQVSAVSPLWEAPGGAAMNTIAEASSEVPNGEPSSAPHLKDPALIHPVPRRQRLQWDWDPYGRGQLPEGPGASGHVPDPGTTDPRLREGGQGYHIGGGGGGISHGV